MLLLLDVGNTNTVVGIHDGNTLLHTWRIATDKNKTADEYFVLLNSLFITKQLNISSISDVVISSVVPIVTQTMCWLTENQLQKPLLLVSHQSITNISILLDDPATIGADLLVAAAAVFAKYKKTAIIVDLGTATTLTVVTDTGDFLGGAIVAGVEVSLQNLFDTTANLSQMKLTDTPKAIGASTEAALQSGAVFGYAGLLDGIIDNMLKELDEKSPLIIATGGQAQFITHHSKHIQIVDNDLIFDGLKVIYDLTKEAQKN